MRDTFLPASLEILNAKFPLVDNNYVSPFADYPLGYERDKEVHLRGYEMSKYMTQIIDDETNGINNVILVSYGTCVISGVRGFLALNEYPVQVPDDYYDKDGKRRHPVDAGVASLARLQMREDKKWDLLYYRENKHLEGDPSFLCTFEIDVNPDPVTLSVKAKRKLFEYAE